MGRIWPRFGAFGRVSPHGVRDVRRWWPVFGQMGPVFDQLRASLAGVGSNRPEVRGDVHWSQISAQLCWPRRGGQVRSSGSLTGALTHLMLMIFRCSGSDKGHGADSRGFSAIRRGVPGRRTLASRPESEPKTQHIVQVRVATAPDPDDRTSGLAWTGLVVDAL